MKMTNIKLGLLISLNCLFRMNSASQTPSDLNLNNYVTFEAIKTDHLTDLTLIREKRQQNDVLFFKQKASELFELYDNYQYDPNSQLSLYYSHYGDDWRLLRFNEYISLGKETCDSLRVNYDSRYFRFLYEDYVHLYSSYFSEDWFSHKGLVFPESFLKYLETASVTVRKILNEPYNQPDDDVIFPEGDQSGGDIKVLTKSTADEILSHLDAADMQEKFPFESAYFLDLLTKARNEEHYVVMFFSY